MISPIYIPYIVSGIVGGFAGLSEVFSRYRDAPVSAAMSMSGILYITFNMLISATVLYLARNNVLPLNVDNTTADLSALISQGVYCGVAAMAILRSSILTTRVGTKDVEIGPAAIIDIFRTTMDRAVARSRAKKRANEVQRIMADISFIRSWESLSSIGIALLQSVSAEERASIEQEIAALANKTGRSDEDKALELGLILANCVGFPALEATKSILGNKIGNGKDRPAFVLEQVSRLDTDSILRDLPPICLALNPNVSEDDQKSLSDQINAIADSKLSNGAKSVNAGLILANMIGEENFKSAIDLLSKNETENQAITT